MLRSPIIGVDSAAPTPRLFREALLSALGALTQKASSGLESHSSSLLYLPEILPIWPTSLSSRASQSRWGRFRQSPNDLKFSSSFILGGVRTAHSVRSTSASQMPPCQTCHWLQKPAGKPRLFFEFTPAELQQSALRRRCRQCHLLLTGVEKMQDGTWSFINDVSRVYGYAQATCHDTLTLEVYFLPDRPRIMLELFLYHHPDGMPPSFPYIFNATTWVLITNP